MNPIRRWPALRQLLENDPSGRGKAAQSQSYAGMTPRTEQAQVVKSICPYCAVGCGTLVHVRDGQVVDVEGNPASPINQGTLCPKGADTDGKGRPLRHTAGVAFLGGAALDNEENYLIKKFCVGTGVVAVENQARI